MEVEDKVDDESLESLRLAEETQAAAGELPSDFQGFSLHLSESLGLEDQPGPKPEEPKSKLESFPAIEMNRLSERVKKYKDHALARKSKFNTSADRLRDEGATGHETLIGNGKLAFVNGSPWHVLPQERSRGPEEVLGSLDAVWCFQVAHVCLRGLGCAFPVRSLHRDVVSTCLWATNTSTHVYTRTHTHTYTYTCVYSNTSYTRTHMFVLPLVPCLRLYIYYGALKNYISYI